MEFGILGPLEVRAAGRALALGGAKPRALLAVLLTHANQPVSAERLAMALWGEDTPVGAVKTVQVHVSRLRKALGNPGVLVTTSAGYCLRVDPEQLDAARFDRLLDAGREALTGGRTERAAEQLREALALWRGAPLDEFAWAPFAAAEIRRLDELRLTALEDRVEADLRLGLHGSLIAELEALVAANPTHERFAEQLMLALYRSGRQAEALTVYQRMRTRLTEDLGLEPGPALKTLQAEILAQAASLELAPRDISASEGLGGAPRRPIRGLPRARSGLLGRRADTHALVDLLRRDDVQLITVTGPGGVGKTSVAVEVAHRLLPDFADGVAFVDLAPLANPAGAADAVLHVLGCKPEPGARATETLCHLVAAREQLLVLDNFEHLIDAAPLVVDLLDAAPRLKLLVTSRAALELRDEHRYPLDPLALPRSCDPVAVAAAPATALFIAHTRARDPAFQLTADVAKAIATVCARVDGLPLAVELAAARGSVLSPQEIARQLDRVLATLGSGPRDAPRRQQTLRATLDWSYDLLDHHERATFAHFGAFAGGCTIEAAAEVLDTSLDRIDALIAKGMLGRRVALDGETRLVMLEPVREYAAERLAADRDRERVGERHSRYYHSLAKAASRELRGSRSPAWLTRLDTEADNLRRSLARDRRTCNPERVLDLAVALEHWWYDRALWAEGRDWIEDAIANAQDDLPAQLRAGGLRVAAQLATAQADFVDSLACSNAALALYRELDDVAGASRCLVNIAFVHSFVGRADAAQAAAVEAVRLGRSADEWTLASALYAHAATAVDLLTARRLAEEAAALFQRAGDLKALASLWQVLSSRALHEGRTDETERLTERSLWLAEQIHDRVYSIYALGNLAFVALERGNRATATQRFGEVLQRCRTTGLRRPVCQALLGLAALAALAGNQHRAARLAGASAAVRFGQAITPAERRLHDRVLDPARRQLGPDSWERHFARGHSLGLEDAILLGIESATRDAGEPALAS